MAAVVVGVSPFLPCPGDAQTIKPPAYDSVAEKSQFRIGLRYTSDYYFVGRADSAAAPYLSPSLTYYHKSGFFARSSLSYLTAAEEGRIDLVTLSGGYDYYGKKFMIGASVSQYFFSDESYNVLAEMSSYLNAYAGYDLSAVMIYVDASLGFSGSTDLFLGGEISRTFYLAENKLRVTPGVNVNAGTQKYYSEYYSQRSTQTGSGKGKGPGNPPATTTSLTILENDKFQLLDYETELLVSYKFNDTFLIHVSSTWLFPVNPATVVGDQGTYTEELKNGFYWSSGIRITF